MRRAKENHEVPKLYYRPEQTTCPHCETVLRRSHQLWQKYVVFLRGRYWVVNLAYRCPNPACPEPHRVYASPEAQRLTVRGSSFALEVIVQIGYWRFWKRWTVAQIHEVLTQQHQLPICEREVLYLLGVFLVLLRCTYHLRLAEHDAQWRRHGIFVSIDALKPEKGNQALYVVRELKFGLILHVVSLLSTDHRTLARRLLQPVKELGYRIRGLVSDDEKALVIAVAKTWPGVAHQTCQFHCLREAATPISNADRAFKKELKKAIREPFYAAYRQLKQELNEDDPRAEVLATYAELIRQTLTEGSKPPFDLGGLRVFEDLARLEASLKRSQKKGVIPSWGNCWQWSHCVIHLSPAIDSSSANVTTLWNWSVVWNHRRWKVRRAQAVVRSSDKSKSFWRSSSSKRKNIPKMPGWWRISAPPSTNVGRAYSSAMLGRSATARIMIWKPSSVGSGRGSDKLMDAKRPMSLSFATASGRSSSTPAKPMKRSCNV